MYVYDLALVASMAYHCAPLVFKETSWQMPS